MAANVAQGPALRRGDRRTQSRYGRVSNPMSGPRHHVTTAQPGSTGQPRIVLALMHQACIEMISPRQ